MKFLKISDLLLVIIPFLLIGCLGESSNCRRAKVDLMFMKQTLIDNHPGIYDAQNPFFSTELRHHYENALKQIAGAKNKAACDDALITFARSFNDTHVQLDFLDRVDHSPSQTFRESALTMQELVYGIYWIRIPTFTLDEKQQIALHAIIEQLPKLRSTQLLVFDLRGNGGGNSMWGTKIIEALFGKNYMMQQRDLAHVHEYIEWRASRDNNEHMKQLAAQFEKEFGAESEYAIWANHIAIGMERAYQNKHYFFREESETREPSNKIQIKDPVSAKIILVIDSGCGSACLDFIDDLKSMNHLLTLVGQTTSADSVYMEIRFVDLPSGKGRFTFPIKIFRGRSRGNNVPYVPDVFMDTNQDIIELQHSVLTHYNLNHRKLSLHDTNNQ